MAAGEVQAEGRARAGRAWTASLRKCYKRVVVLNQQPAAATMRTHSPALAAALCCSLQRVFSSEQNQGTASYIPAQQDH